MVGRSEHSKKARKRMRAGVRPEAARAREQALKERVRHDRPTERSRSRAEIVGEREKARLERRAAEPRYANKEKVDEGVAQRTDKRLERLQRPVKGVDASDGYNGLEARQVKNALAREKAGRGIGREVRELAHDKTRTGGIGGQVRELAHRQNAPAPGEVQSTKNLEKLADRRVQRLHNEGNKITTPQRPGTPLYRIAEGAPAGRRRRARKAA